MTDAPGDMAAKLESDADAVEMIGTRGASDVRLIKSSRAAASLLRDMREREKALREALEPFADWAATYDADDDTDTDKLVSDRRMLIIESIDGTLSGSLINVGDFRRAAKALETK